LQSDLGEKARELKEAVRRSKKRKMRAFITAKAGVVSFRLLQSE
jgi:hypothetical protein